MQKKEKKKKMVVCLSLPRMAGGALLPGGQSRAFVAARLSSGNCLVPSPVRTRTLYPHGIRGGVCGPQACLSLRLPEFLFCEPLPVRTARHM